MGATENAGFNVKIQRTVGIYQWLDRLLSYLLATRQWYVCKKTNPGTNRQPITVEINVAFIFVRRQTAVKVIRARFTKYLTTILRLSYDNAIVTIDLRRTSNLPNRLTKGAGLFLGMIHLQNGKIV